MSEFALDTTGHFHVMPGHPLHRFMAANVLTWSDLDAFTQGYVEAALKDAPATGPLSNLRFPAFSDLAPETLAAILKDCARFLALGLGENDREHGRRFWLMRVRKQVGGGWHPDFPPLTAYLGDDGKVYLREAQS